MALTRKILKGMGLTEEQVDSIIEAHTETVDGLKEKIAALTADAEKLPSVQKELDELKAKGGNWEEKYKTEHSAFEAFKAETVAAKAKAEKVALYTAALKSAGVAESKIPAVLKVTDLSTIEVADGKLSDDKAVAESIKKEWSDFIVSTKQVGATVTNPPANAGTAMTRADIAAIKDRDERRAAIANNLQLFK